MEIEKVAVDEGVRVLTKNNGEVNRYRTQEKIHPSRRIYSAK